MKKWYNIINEKVIHNEAKRNFVYFGDAQSVSAAIKSGVYDFLVKSDWHLKDLVKKVKEVLK